MKSATALAAAKAPSSLKLTRKEDVFERMQEIYDDIARRAFEIFDSNGRVIGRDLDHSLQAESEVLNPTRIEFLDTGEALKVQAEVPGFKAEELEISVEPQALTITGKKQAREELKNGNKVVYSERSASEILRVVQLPEPVVPDKVTARLTNGVLEFEMPKAAPAKKIKIEPKAA
jgi:HSP20 family protein